MVLMLLLYAHFQLLRTQLLLLLLLLLASRCVGVPLSDGTTVGMVFDELSINVIFGRSNHGITQPHRDLGKELRHRQEG